MSCSLPVQVPESVVDAINTEVGNVKKLLEGETSAESIKEAVSSLQKALMKIGEHLAQSGQVRVMQLLIVAISRLTFCARAEMHCLLGLIVSFLYAGK